MSDLFISYAHADNDLIVGGFSIKRLTMELQDRGYKLWLDILSIPGGSHWESEIELGIRNAKYILVIATEQSARQGSYVFRELDLARKTKPPVSIIPIFLEPTHLAKLELNERQGIDFSKPFDEALKRLLDSIPNVKPQPDQLHQSHLPELIEDGTVTFGEAEKRWYTPLPFGKRVEAPVGLLIDRSAIGMSAFLVGKRQEKITKPDVARVFLQFTDSIQKSSFNVYLEYMSTRPTPLWTLLIRAPIVYVQDEGYGFALSERNETEWKEAVGFILKALPIGIGTCRHVEFYLQAPLALIMALGLKENFDFQCDVFHFRKGKVPIDQQYQMVYSYTP